MRKLCLLALLGLTSLVVLGGSDCQAGGRASCAAQFGPGTAIVVCANSQLRAAGKTKPTFKLVAKGRRATVSLGVAKIQGKPLRPGETVTVRGAVPADAVLLVHVRLKNGRVIQGGFYWLPETINPHAFPNFTLKIRAGGCPWAGRSGETSGMETPDLRFLSAPSCGHKKSGGRKAVTGVLAAAAERFAAMTVANVWYAAAESGDWETVCPYLGGRILEGVGGDVESCRSFYRARAESQGPCNCHYTIEEIQGPTYIEGRLIDKNRIIVSARVLTGEHEDDEWGLSLQKRTGGRWVIVDENG